MLRMALFLISGSRREECLTMRCHRGGSAARRQFSFHHREKPERKTPARPTPQGKNGKAPINVAISQELVQLPRH